MSSDKKWKEAILSSGIPLEAGVSNQLRDRGCVVFGEYEYAVATPDDQRLLRSVDVRAWWDLVFAKLELVVECKYRRDGVKWFFLPPSLRRLTDVEWITNSLVSPFVPPWHCDNVFSAPVVNFGHHPASKDAHKLHVVSKGIEIIPGNSGSRNGKEKHESNEHAIKNALAQVRYGTATCMYPFPPVKLTDFSRYLYNDFHFLLPVIVTTAELFVLDKNVGVEEVRAADKVDEIACEVGAVIFEKRSDYPLQHHTRTLLVESYKHLLTSPKTAAQAAACQGMFGPAATNVSTFSDSQVRYGPDSVIIVSLAHLESLLDSLSELFTVPGALQKYDWIREKGEDGIIWDIEKHREARDRRNQAAVPRNE